MRQNRGFSLGFSLIELMVVISIIGLTFGVIITTYMAAQRSSRDSKRQADLRTIQGGLQQYYTDQNGFPPTLDLSTATSITAGTGSSLKIYLKNIPKDPTTTQSYCYASAMSQANSSTCTDVNNCNSYTLYANLENPPSGSGSSRCGAGTTQYNFQLTPP